MAAKPTRLTNLHVTGDLTVDGSSSVGGASISNNEINADVTWLTNKKVQFRDTGIYLNSGADGKLTVSADGTGADDITLDGTVTLSDNLSVATGKQLKPKGGTATAAGGAATLSQQIGVVTSESITTAAGSVYTLTLTNTLVAATSLVFASVANGSNAQGTPEIGLIAPASGEVTIQVKNTHSSQAFNGTVKISFAVFNPS